MSAKYAPSLVAHIECTSPSSDGTTASTLRLQIGEFLNSMIIWPTSHTNVLRNGPHKNKNTSIWRIHPNSNGKDWIVSEERKRNVTFTCHLCRRYIMSVEFLILDKFSSCSHGFAVVLVCHNAKIACKKMRFQHKPISS